MKRFLPYFSILVFFSFLNFNCCSVCPGLRCIKKEFKNKMDSNIKNGTQIYYNGFYIFEHGFADKNTNKIRKDTIKVYFFPNGLFAFNCYFYNGKFESAQWGYYLIIGDTIKTKYTTPGSWMVPYYAREQWLKIINKTTLQTIYFNTICDAQYEYDLANISLANFQKLDTLPDYKYCWLLKEKWFWKNESEWKKYMDSIKRK